MDSAAPGVQAITAPYVIPATRSLHERRPRTLKHGDSFAVFDPLGDAAAGSGSPEGLYHCDTRHLSLLRLSLRGRRPILLSSTLRDDNAALICDLTNPDLHDADGRLVLEHDLVHIRRACFLWDGACHERLVLRNHDGQAQRLCVEIAFAADFADLFEVRGARRARRGSDSAAAIADDRVTLGYTGLDGVLRQTVLRFDPAPDLLEGGRAVFDLVLPPRQTRTLLLEVHCRPAACMAAPRRAYARALRMSRRALRRAAGRAAAVTSSNEIFNEAVRRSVSDLYMLITDTPHGPYPYAGVPWFSAAFGRDALITALQTLWLDPAIAQGVLRYLAAHQSRVHDPGADAEPGKILHEQRHGEMAQLGEVPFRRYYGSVDATPLFVMLAGAYLERTADVGLCAELWPSIEAALEWIDRHGDCDGDGFVEYRSSSHDGLVNQGWKDSHDAVFDADGRLARGPIALAEVQAYVYGAWRAAAAIAQRLGHAARAAGFEQCAANLQRSFDRAFFDEALGSYVLALDGDKRPCRVRSSNAGHALYTGIAYPERAGTVVATLMHGASFCGWGVRTIAASEARYNPMSYHNGSVWPHDNALIAAGFARYGYKREAARIFEGLFAASMHFDLRRLPELFCGFARQRRRGPTFYPVACTPQAWSATAPLSLLQSCLGLGFDTGARQISFDEPTLPAFLDEVVLRHLALGSGHIDIAVRRAGSQVVVEVLARSSGVRTITRS